MIEAAGRSSDVAISSISKPCQNGVDGCGFWFWSKSKTMRPPTADFCSKIVMEKSGLPTESLCSERARAVAIPAGPAPASDKGQLVSQL